MDFWIFDIMYPRTIAKLIGLVIVGLILLYLYSLGDRETRVHKFVQRLSPRGQFVFFFIVIIVIVSVSWLIYDAILFLL
jgi:hypothetical protein